MLFYCGNILLKYRNYKTFLANKDNISLSVNIFRKLCHI